MDMYKENSASLHPQIHSTWVNFQSKLDSACLQAWFLRNDQCHSSYYNVLDLVPLMRVSWSPHSLWYVLHTVQRRFIIPNRFDNYCF